MRGVRSIGTAVLSVAVSGAPALARAEGPPAATAATTKPTPLPPRYAWADNVWTGFGGRMASSGVGMAGGAGLAVLTEPRAHNATQSRFLHVVGLGIFGLNALSLVTSPIASTTRKPKKPNAPLAPAPFFVGTAAVALGGGAIAAGSLATLGDEGDSPWDDGRGVAIASGAMVAAFGITVALIGATDSGAPDAPRPWSKRVVSARIGPAGLGLDGRF